MSFHRKERGPCFNVIREAINIDVFPLKVMIFLAKKEEVTGAP